MFLHEEDTGSETDSERELKVEDIETFERHVFGKKLAGLELYLLYDMIIRACKNTAQIIENGCIYSDTPKEGCFPKVDTVRTVSELQDAIITAIHACNIIGYAFPSHCNTPIKIGDGKAPFCIGYNVMTGPNNLLVNLPVGTLFGIWRNPCHGGKCTELKYDELVGHEMVGSGFFLYGTIHVLVIAFEHGKGVYEYQFDQGLGAFLLQNKNPAKLPKRGHIYSVNEGYTLGWDEPTKKMVTRMKDPRYGRPRTSYSIGSLVPDFYRIFRSGGFYLYPANKMEPKGGLLLIQECWPLGYICNEAGGFATEGNEGILSIVPTGAWEKVPFYAGSITDCIAVMDLNFTYIANKLVPPKPSGTVRRICPICLEERRKNAKLMKTNRCPGCSYTPKKE